MAEEIGSEIQTIEMSGIEYPVTVRVEGMAIRLQDESGKVVNTLLKSGEDIVISNPMVGKLKVSSNVIPEVYALEQNYPNPFNPATTIEFSIPEDVENVKLTIYDALGQKVAELVNGKLEAGRYNYQWDASSVASGLYIYQLQTSKFTSTKKMMLLK
jgi:flagellar hook assembly protein FlgD